MTQKITSNETIVRMPCQCGGMYSIGLGTDSAGLERPFVTHTLPVCSRYGAIATLDDIVRYARENNGAHGEKN